MIISLTGTPGTGKTTVAAELDFKVLDLTSFVKEHGLGQQGEEFEVSIPQMVDELEEELDEAEDTVIEGHLSHHFPTDFCIVLRCEPRELRDRLQERGYGEEKIEENVDSEALDLILSEAVENQENVIEIDTTGREAEDVAEEIEERIEERDTGYGEVDWSDYF